MGVRGHKWRWRGSGERAEDNELSLIHDPKLPYCFKSSRWKREYNPDILFVSKNIRQQAIKNVNKPIPRSQHCLISCKVLAIIRPLKVLFKRKLKFSKANWPTFSRDLDSELKSIPATHKQYDSFIEIVKKVSREHIPKGSIVNYISGLSSEKSEDFETYSELFNENSFSAETSDKGEQLMQTIAEEKRKHWHSLLNEMDMKHSS